MEPTTDAKRSGQDETEREPIAQRPERSADAQTNGSAATEFVTPDDILEPQGAPTGAAQTAPHEAPDRASEDRGSEGVEPQSAVVPLPGTHHQEPRRSFWKRINLRPSSASGSQIERVLARLDAIESRATATELSIGNRIQALDNRFTEVWEVEEQLSQLNDLRETLEEVNARQLGLDVQLRAIDRRLKLVSVLIATAALAGVVVTFQAMFQ